MTHKYFPLRTKDDTCHCGQGEDVPVHQGFIGDGCPSCGMAYSFFFAEQFHTSTCPQAAPTDSAKARREDESRAAFEDAFLDDGEGPFLGN